MLYISSAAASTVAIRAVGKPAPTTNAGIGGCDGSRFVATPIATTAGPLAATMPPTIMTVAFVRFPPIASAALRDSDGGIASDGDDDDVVVVAHALVVQSASNVVTSKEATPADFNIASA